MKEKIIKKLKSIDLVIFLIMLMPFLFGTFHNFSVFLVALILQIIILIFYIKNKKVNIKINSGLICSGLLFIFSLLSVIWAVDRNDAFIGSLRYLSIVIFNFLLMQLTKQKKEKVLEIIPYSAVLMLIISLIVGFIPACKHIVYTQGGSLTGFFTYANTFALYLLLGIIIITNKKIDKYTIIAITIGLIIGIMLTKSRATFILTILYFVYFSLNKYNCKKRYYFFTFIALFSLSSAILFILNKTKIINISENLGTIFERLLYWKDSLKLILHNPFGYGYMGFSYKIYEVQTGAYITKFVHNEYLQMILDIGIIPTLIFIIILIKSIISKENSKLNKLILITIMLHIFLDLDLQSIIIFYIMFMCLDEKLYKEFEIKFNYTFTLGLLIVSFLYGYYCVASFMNFIVDNQIANEMLSNYTEAKVELMKSDDINIVHKYAEEILKNNKYEARAYNANAVYYLLSGDFDKMVECKKKELFLDKYNMKLYEEYAMMLDDVLSYYEQKNDTKNYNKYVNYLLEIEDILENVKNSTSFLAYKITDNLSLELSQNIKDYINYTKERGKLDN